LIILKIEKALPFTKL